MLVVFLLILLSCQLNFKSASKITQAKNATNHIGHTTFTSASNLSRNDFDSILTQTALKHFNTTAKNDTELIKLYLGQELSRVTYRKMSAKLSSILSSACGFCKNVTAGVILYRRSSIAHKRLLKKFLYYVCEMLTSKLSPDVCRKLVDLNMDYFWYVIKNNEKLTSRLACAIILQSFDCFIEDRPSWEIEIPPGVSVEPETVDKDKGTSYKVLHLTDVHLDSMYTVGKTSQCGKPLCCQSDDPRHNNGSGEWGSYGGCDMPWSVFENLLDMFAGKHNGFSSHFEYIYFTGDILSHRVWDISRERTESDIRRFYRTIKAKLGMIPVFPVIGNHDTKPLNVFAPLSIDGHMSIRWLYNLFAVEWSEWLPKSAIETIRKGGYYSVSVRTGLRVIVLNNNVCYTFNWWLLYENEDPYQQLQWLADELLKAEKANEFIHLLYHIPPGDPECLVTWSVQFQRIVERFTHTIKAQFFGHTHYDELKVFYNSTNLAQAVGVGFNGASLTTYVDVNPSFKIYDVDPTTYVIKDVLDYTEWIYQVHLANLEPKKPPQWYSLYKFTKAFRMNSLAFEDLDGLVQRLSKDRLLQLDYYNFKVRDSEVGAVEGCDDKCLKNNLCDIVTTVHGDRRKCKMITKHGRHKHL